MRQSQGQKKPSKSLHFKKKKKNNTQDLKAVFNHLAVPLTQHGSLHVSHPCGSLQSTGGNVDTKQYRNPRSLLRYHITSQVVFWFRYQCMHYLGFSPLSQPRNARVTII